MASLREPLYEASAMILVSVDHNRASVRDDITIYQAEDRVRELVLSDNTLQGALALLGGNQLSDSYQTPVQFRSSTRIAQHPAGLELLFYAHDPGFAAEAANAWASASLSSLEEAYIHAVRAADLQQALYEAHCSLQLLEEGSQTRAQWVCTSGERNIDVDNLPQKLLEEAKASRGILPFFSFSLGREAVPPETEVLWSRSGLVLGGLIAGVMFGCMLAVIIGYFTAAEMQRTDTKKYPDS
jgi:uncharacterized protein involved in exopolysaccharide biosynthesis